MPIYSTTRLWQTFPLLLAFLPFSSPLVAQPSEPDVDRQSSIVIDKFVEAMGGEMALRSIDSFQITSTSANDASSKQYSTIRTFDKDRSHAIYEGSFITIFNGTESWVFSNGIFLRLLKKKDIARSQENFPWPNLVVEWPNYDGIVQYVGEKEFEDLPVIHIQFENRFGLTIDRYFGRDSHLLVRQVIGKWEHRFEYQPVEDIQMLSKCIQLVDGTVMSVNKFSQIKINLEVSQLMFEMPKDVRTRIRERDKMQLDELPDETH